MTAILSVVTRLSGIFIVIMGVRGLIPYVVALKESPAFAMHDQLGLTRGFCLERSECFVDRQDAVGFGCIGIERQGVHVAIKTDPTPTVP